jgi:glycosyltransferase involved in cell wall biosynthesis
MARIARAQRAHIYCSNDFDTLLAGVVASGIDGLLVYDSHELYPDMVGRSSFVRAIFRVAEAILIRQADLVMTVNEFIADIMKSRYNLREVAVVHNYAAAMPHKDNGKNKPPKGQRTKVVLYQGMYHPDRALENLARSAAYLRPDVRLVFRGSGQIEAELRRIASNFGNVVFDAPVPLERLIEAARNADVGVVTYPRTNLNNYFSSPNKLFEYLSAGLAIAGSNLPFISKIVLENKVGDVFDSQDPKDIARAVNHVTRDEILPNLRRNAELAAKKFSWELEKERLIAHYDLLFDKLSRRISQQRCLTNWQTDV